MVRNALILLTASAVVVGAGGCGGPEVDRPEAATPGATAQSGLTDSAPDTMKDPMAKTDDEWRASLTPEQYRILRRKGTEMAFTGAHWDNHEEGRYVCAGCGQVLFTSAEKFDSGCGWPSYWQPVDATSVTTAEDNTLGMRRTEVMCSNCGGHLGHVFEDGPKPTGLRYCINSGATEFKPGPVTPPGDRGESDGKNTR